MLLKRNGLPKNKVRQGIRDAPKRQLLHLVTFLVSGRVVHDRDIKILSLERQPIIILFGNTLLWITLERRVWQRQNLLTSSS